MVRLARVVHPGQPYHITHRGNHKESVFFTDEERREYLRDLAECAEEAGVDIWA